MKTEMMESGRATMSLATKEKEHDNTREVFEKMRRSTILKTDYYRAEPDHFVSDVINF